MTEFGKMTRVGEKHISTRQPRRHCKDEAPASVPKFLGPP